MFKVARREEVHVAYKFQSDTSVHLQACSTWVSIVRFELVYQRAGALGTPWQTQCNEAMPWSGMHGLINRVYLQ